MNEQKKQLPQRYYIGWDVGAWHCGKQGKGSKDAIAIFDAQLNPVGRFRAGTLSYAVLKSQQVENPGEWFINEIFEWCDTKCDDLDQAEFCLAIDTPLGWPSAFLHLLDSWNSVQTEDSFDSSVIKLNEKKICNPLLHRKSETSLGQSLSAVQDQIGSQSTKAICLLAALKAKRISTGVWKTSYPNITFIETYPAPCMRSFNFLDAMKSIEVGTPVASVDVFDAIVCALVAREYSTPSKCVRLTSPTSDNDAEGWIFTPEDCLSAVYGLSYGRLIELQSPRKQFSELICQVQMSIVMAAMLKQHALESKKKCKANTHTLPAEIANWLRKPEASTSVFKSVTADDLKSLHKLLHPKTEKDKVPSDGQFAKIAMAVQGKDCE